MKNRKTYPCTRCNGKGIIPFYHGIMGGVCFKCQGSGKQLSKPPIKSQKWAILGYVKFTGEPILLYMKNAKTSDLAINIAKETFTKASIEFRTENSLDDAVAVPAEKYEKLYSSNHSHEITAEIIEQEYRNSLAK